MSLTFFQEVAGPHSSEFVQGDMSDDLDNDNDFDTNPQMPAIQIEPITGESGADGDHPVPGTSGGGDHGPVGPTATVTSASQGRPLSVFL